MNLKNLYKNHKSKVADKWSSYIEVYDEIFLKYKNLPINLLEIGIQNGGSLEIYSEYFLKAKKFIGCDINKNCEKISFKDDRIELLIGDINEQKISENIYSSEKFDIIIDDGSHKSKDIINSFSKYFSHLNHSGVYIIEDLHCSYWKEFGGGLFFPISSINFFKKFVDIINYDHWGIEKNINWFLNPFARNLKINFENFDFTSIKSIQFFNSMCIIHKGQNFLGERVVKGKYADAFDNVDSLKTDNLDKNKLNQQQNIWSNTDLLPEDELHFLRENFKKNK
tara:strand:+ start:1720 stop:2562 length:843 start_codon:yes stop_codon:yes gene_type:complete